MDRSIIWLSIVYPLYALLTIIVMFWKLIEYYENKYMHTPLLVKKQLKRITLLARITNNQLIRIFGFQGDRFRSILTLRMALIVFCCDVLLASITFISIVICKPSDMHIHKYPNIYILIANIVGFILFNFIGDMVAILYTRVHIYRIAIKNANMVRAIGYSFLGVIVGYVVMLSPSLLFAVVSLFITKMSTQWIFKSGLLGSGTISWLLIIFAAEGPNVIIKILSIITLASLTIPIATFLVIAALWYLAYETIEIKKNKMLVKVVVMYIAPAILTLITMILLGYRYMSKALGL